MNSSKIIVTQLIAHLIRCSKWDHHYQMMLHQSWCSLCNRAGWRIPTRGPASARLQGCWTPSFTLSHHLHQNQRPVSHRWWPQGAPLQWRLQAEAASYLFFASSLLRRRQAVVVAVHKQSIEISSFLEVQQKDWWIIG